jgi:hypothetical protein
VERFEKREVNATTELMSGSFEFGFDLSQSSEGSTARDLNTVGSEGAPNFAFAESLPQDGRDAPPHMIDSTLGDD